MPRPVKVHVVRPLAGAVFVDQTLHGLPGTVELVEVVLEHGLAAVVVQEGIALADAIVLPKEPIEQLGHAGVVGQHEATDLVRVGHVRAGPGQRHLDRGWSPRDEVDELSLPNTLKGLMDLGRVDVVALHDVQEADVATRRAGVGADHNVLGLGKTAHHVQYCRLADASGRIGLACRIGQCEGGVARHEEVTPRRGDERGQQSNEVVVHVSRIPQRGGRCRHDGGHQTIQLIDRRIVNPQPIDGDAIQSRIVQNHHSIGIQGQAFHRQHRVVRLNYHITLTLIPIGKHRIRLHELLGKVIVERLEEVAAHPGTGTTGNAVGQHESLEGVRVVRLAIDHINHLLVMLLALPESAGPVVAGPSSVLGNEQVFGVEQVAVRAVVGDFVHDARFQIDQQRAGDVMLIVGLVKEHILAIVHKVGRAVEEERIGGGVGCWCRRCRVGGTFTLRLEDTIGRNSVLEA